MYTSEVAAWIIVWIVVLVLLILFNGHSSDSEIALNIIISIVCVASMWFIKWQIRKIIKPSSEKYIVMEGVEEADEDANVIGDVDDDEEVDVLKDNISAMNKRITSRAAWNDDEFDNIALS